MTSVDDDGKIVWQCGGLKNMFTRPLFVERGGRYKTVSPRKSIRQSPPHRSVHRSKKALLNDLVREVIHEPQPTAAGTLEKVLEILGET